MIVSQAEEIVATMFAPMPLDAVFDAVGAHRSFDLKGGPAHPRTALLGADPAAAILAGFATHAARLDCHSPAPLGPPPGPVAAAGPDAFAAQVAAYHDRNYTVRVPDARALSPALRELARALEILLHAPVDASLFWSRAHARAKIHYDNNDNISVQLAGRKRWFVSTEPASLHHSDRHRAAPEPRLDAHRVIDVGPGDLVYIPRGLPHAVESTTDSIHVSVLFTPLTWRDALVAAVDHMSDLARPVRATAATRGGGGLGQALAPGLADAFEQLVAAVRTPGFAEQALASRANREVGSFARATPTAPGPPPLTAATRLRRAPLAAMHVASTGDGLDLAVPGGHVMLHAAAGPALAFIATTPAFAAGDLPGLPPEHRLALAERLVVAGLLEADPDAECQESPSAFSS